MVFSVNPGSFRECDYFLLCPGGGYSLWWPIRGGSAPNPGELLNKYLYGKAPPRGPTLTRRESVLYLRLIPILWQCGFPAVYTKGVPFVNRRYTKSWKMAYKRLRGGPPPYKKLFEYQSPPPLLPGCYVSMKLGPAHKCCFKDFEFSRIVRSSDLSCTR